MVPWLVGRLRSVQLAVAVSGTSQRCAHLDCYYYTSTFVSSLYLELEVKKEIIPCVTSLGPCYATMAGASSSRIYPTLRRMFSIKFTILISLSVPQTRITRVEVTSAIRIGNVGTITASARRTDIADHVQ